MFLNCFFDKWLFLNHLFLYFYGMRYQFLLFIGLFVGTLSNAQKTSDPSLFAKTITARSLQAHLNIIAGAEMEGRDTPSPGLEKAADYIAEQFKKAGVLPGNNGSYRQTFSLGKDSVTGMSLKIDDANFSPYDDFAPAMFMPPQVDLHFSEYIFVGYGIVDEKQNDYEGADVKDKLVIFLNGEPEGYKSAQTGRNSPASLFNKIRKAMEKGAAAILIIREDLPSRLSNFSRYQLISDGAASNRFGITVPTFFINENVVRRVSGYDLSTVKNAIGTEVSIPMVEQADISLSYKTDMSKKEVSNVIGVVEGSDKKDEYVIITAHYDHVGKDMDGNIYYGADDDGSGTVSVIEMANAFAKAKKAGKGPRRTIIFMTVCGEEKGLWGSEYYSSNPVYPLDKTSADLNIDMIGRIGDEYIKDKDSANYVYVIGDDRLSTDLAPILNDANNRYLRLKLDRKYNDPKDPERFYYRSDHYNFAKKGVPVIFFFNGVHPDYHKPTDTVDKINFELMAKRAQLVFNTAWEIANRNEMLKRDLKLQ